MCPDEDLHGDHESPSVGPEKVGFSTSGLLGRPNPDGPIQGGDSEGQGHNLVNLGTLRVCPNRR